MELVHAKKLNAADLQAYAISIGVPMSAAKVNGKWLEKEALMDLIKSVVEERHSQVVRTAARRMRHSIARFDEGFFFPYKKSSRFFKKTSRLFYRPSIDCS
jgi:hypothetical protein